MQSPFVRTVIRRIDTGKAYNITDELAVEEPLEISLVFGDEKNRKSKIISVTMRTPGNDEELAAGFLFTEGIIQHNNQVNSINSRAFENKISVSLHNETIPTLHNIDRNFYTTSSCGVCGKTSIEAVKTASAFNEKIEDLQISSKVITTLPERLKQQQHVFQSTGGLHASALFEENGTFKMLREDVGRHNALDKLLGAAFFNDHLPLSKKILLLSGRASFELVQKASMAGIKIIAAIGAPSSLAVELATESGITLIGFLRGERFNIYSHPERIIL